MENITLFQKKNNRFYENSPFFQIAWIWNEKRALPVLSANQGKSPRALV
jgi:hypothetical protein